MKEHPIIFSTEMVRAILDGKKTQTRRILKPQPDLGLDPFDSYSHIEVGMYHPAMVDKNGEMYPGDEIFGAYTDDGEWGWKCPYGQVGDSLWVRETHYRYGRWAKNGWTKSSKQSWKFVATTDQIRYIDNPPEKIWDGWTREQLNSRGHSDWHKRSSIHMPRWASRINLEITDIRVERLQEIDNHSSWKEGIPPFEQWNSGITSHNPVRIKKGLGIEARDCFAMLWDSINAKRGFGWETNCWTWVLSFKVIDND